MPINKFAIGRYHIIDSLLQKHECVNEVLIFFTTFVFQ